VIPTIITQIASGKQQIKLGSIHPTRDFNYVGDTVSGFFSALDSDQAVGEIINLGSGFEISIGETAKLIADVMGAEIEILTDTQRLRPEKSEVEQLLADNTKAKKLLEWEPKYCGGEGFRRGLKKTIEWIADPTNLLIYKSGIYNI
jgi:dTDP-glucose 4,6-dehydratase